MLFFETTLTVYYLNFYTRSNTEIKIKSEMLHPFNFVRRGETFSFDFDVAPIVTVVVFQQLIT